MDCSKKNQHIRFSDRSWRDENRGRYPGCTVIAVPRPSLSGNGQTSATSSVLNLTGHKDESLCRTLAEMVCCASGKNVACSGGFHMDQITLQQIQEVEAAVRKLGEFLIKELI